jgi:glycine hydroxymethyltransferase
VFATGMSIEGYDDELAQAIANERRRQEEHLELISAPIRR